MKTKLLTLVTLAFIGLSTANAQVGIGTTNPENTAALDVDSNEKGFLPPRMDTDQRDGINGGTIAQGLVIYNTDVHCLQWYDGTDWFDPCEEPTSGGGGQQAPGLNLDPLPAGITLQAIGDYSIVSADDDDYLDASGNLVINGTEADLPTDLFTGNPNPNNVADGTTETLIDVQGTLTTTGVTLNIPYETTGAVTLPTYSQTLPIFDFYTEDGVETDVTFSYPETIITGADTGFIQATLQAVTTNLQARKLDLNSGFGPDYLGLVIGMFSYALDDQATQADFNLRIIPGIPDKNIGSGTNDFVYYPVTSDAGRTWLNNNLGAAYAKSNPTQQATGFEDDLAKGDLYQWGRAADGHEKIERGGIGTNSVVYTGVQTDLQGVVNFEPLASNAWNGQFIARDAGTDNWVNVAATDGLGNGVDDLWQGVDGINNPCPEGYRLPTDSEWLDELSAVGGWANTTEAFDSPLKLTGADYRYFTIGTIDQVGGRYWSSSAGSTQARALQIEGNNSAITAFRARASARSVRCIREE